MFNCLFKKICVINSLFNYYIAIHLFDAKVKTKRQDVCAT